MAPNAHEFHESDEKFLAPRGCYVLKHRALARWARVEPVSRYNPFYYKDSAIQKQALAWEGLHGTITP